MFDSSHSLLQMNESYSSSEMSPDLNTFTAEMLIRVTTNSLKVVLRMVRYNPGCLQARSPILFFVRILFFINLKDNGFDIYNGLRNILNPGHDSIIQSPSAVTNDGANGNPLLAIDSSSPLEIQDLIDAQLHSHFDLRILCDILLLYCRSNKLDVLALFDLIPVLCIPSTIDTSFITNFFRGELPILFSTEDKRTIITIFLVMIQQQKICPMLLVKSIQVFVISYQLIYHRW